MKKLNFGSGPNVLPGYENYDLYTEGEGIIKLDLEKLPLPIDDECADEIIVSHVLEHMVEPYRFILECHRILRKGGKLIVKVPSSMNEVGHLRSVHFKNYMGPFDIKYFRGANGQNVGLFQVLVKGRWCNPVKRLNQLYLWLRNQLVDEWSFEMYKL